MALDNYFHIGPGGKVTVTLADRPRNALPPSSALVQRRKLPGAPDSRPQPQWRLDDRRRRCAGILSQDATRTAVPLYFGPDGAELFGWFHRPDGSARGPVIVICSAAGTTR